MRARALRVGDTNTRYSWGKNIPAGFELVISLRNLEAWFLFFSYDYIHLREFWNNNLNEPEYSENMVLLLSENSIKASDWKSFPKCCNDRLYQFTNQFKFSHIIKVSKAVPCSQNGSLPSPTIYHRPSPAPPRQSNESAQKGPTIRKTVVSHALTPPETSGVINSKVCQAGKVRSSVSCYAWAGIIIIRLKGLT